MSVIPLLGSLDRGGLSFRSSLVAESAWFGNCKLKISIVGNRQGKLRTIQSALVQNLLTIWDLIQPRICAKRNSPLVSELIMNSYAARRSVSRSYPLMSRNV